MAYNIRVKPKVGKFLKGFDVLGKMDPYLRITVGIDSLKTDVALGQGRNPAWKKTLTYKISAQQFSQPDLVPLTIEAFDEDIGFDDFMGRYTGTLRDVRFKAGEINLITLFDENGEIAGNLEVEFEAEPYVDEKKRDEVLKKKVIGTIVLRPTSIKFEGTQDSNQEVYLVFFHDDIAYQSGVSEGKGSEVNFRDIISFDQYDDVDLRVKCLENDPRGNNQLGEAIVNISELQKKGDKHSLQIQLDHGNKILGELSMDVEFYDDVFESPVKVFPVIEVNKGEYISKKFKYSNPDKVKKNIRLKSWNRDLVFIKNDRLTVLPNEFGVVKIRIFAPFRDETREETCRIDIILDDYHEIEESLLFRVKAVQPQ